MKLSCEGSPGEISGAIMGMGIGEPYSQRGSRFHLKAKIKFCLIELCNAAMNSTLLLFELPGHWKGHTGAN